ncbi:hypothetical protein BT63DRAFT_418861 [Microthyrium microscopicum]|uniref:RRM domain-containing protein n=1 Tax=Microthyrium microscopicum TaxID=703497 RepID=A0A6A6TW72_9PEZI|nr:hypothetical protein BT63DRAFT_418861 [Microthyrium microscopicum]
MAPKKESSASSLEAMIKDAREKKKNEALAAKIFGRSTTPNSRNGGANMASRAGVQKVQVALHFSSRSSTMLIFNQRSQSAKPVLTRAVSSSTGRQPRRNNVHPLARRPVTNSDNDQKTWPASKELNIKGMGSGIAIVHAENFAPGTTAADIEAVMAPEAGIVSCSIKVHKPTVIAEIVCTNVDLAHTIANKFNGKKADGRLLHVYLPNQTHAIRNYMAEQEKETKVHTTAGYDDQSYDQQYDDQNGMDVDQAQQDTNQPYYSDQDQRKQNYSPQRPPQQPRRAQPSVQDGRYGFETDRYVGRYEGQRGRGQQERRPHRGGRLASDSMIPQGGYSEYRR